MKEKYLEVYHGSPKSVDIIKASDGPEGPGIYFFRSKSGAESQGEFIYSIGVVRCDYQSTKFLTKDSLADFSQDQSRKEYFLALTELVAELANVDIWKLVEAAKDTTGRSVFDVMARIGADIENRIPVSSLGRWIFENYIASDTAMTPTKKRRIKSALARFDAESPIAYQFRHDDVFMGKINLKTLTYGQYPATLIRKDYPR